MSTEISPAAAGSADEAPFDARQVAREGAICAAGLVRPDGTFRYAYDSQTGEDVPGYNLLRHCGTAWAIADIAAQLGGLEEEAGHAGRAMDWAAKSCVAKFGKSKCLVERGAVKLGGCGLGILALLALAPFGRRTRRVELARDFAEFILICRRKDGDFHHKIDARTKAISPFRSDYYTGEALFGLIRLHQTTGAKRWLDVAADTISMLDAQNYGISHQSHWMTYALSALHEATGDEKALAYAGRIVRDIIDNPAYRARARSAPIACRAEALMAYADMLARTQGRTEGPRWAEVMSAARIDLGLLMQLRTPDGAYMHGAGDPKVQIDYIQHASSAFLGYARNAPLAID